MHHQGSLQSKTYYNRAGSQILAVGEASKQKNELGKFSYVQSNYRKNFINLGALDKMNNFLDLTQRANMMRQNSDISQRTQKILNVKLPSLSEHIHKTQMMQ